jgi:hypothetical protein
MTLVVISMLFVLEIWLVLPVFVKMLLVGHIWSPVCVGDYGGSKGLGMAVAKRIGLG